MFFLVVGLKLLCLTATRYNSKKKKIFVYAKFILLNNKLTHKLFYNSDILVVNYILVQLCFFFLHELQHKLLYKLSFI